MYTDVPRLRALLDADGDCLCCVLDDDGHVRWRADGPADDASAAALLAAVQGLAVRR